LIIFFVILFFFKKKIHFKFYAGDTLFIGGCGRFFEGTAEQMHNSLNNVLAKLPEDTRVFCGHEYTKSNLKFAASVEPDNEYLQQKIQWTNENERTVPSTIGDELKFNPFMRVDKESIKKATGKQSPIEVMAALREMKNNF
jgi:hydroxyacylglutathione hydrolase